MATTWLPKNNFTPRSFLLANGDVVEEPELEETASGLKVRLKGATKSFYSRDQDQAIRRGLHDVARQRETQYWMPIDLDGRAIKEKVGFQLTNTARFDVTSPTRVKATVWWSFKHPTMPIEALLVAQWAGSTGVHNHTITTHLIIPNQSDMGLDAKALSVKGNDWTQVENSIDNYAGRARFGQFIIDNPPEWFEGAIIPDGFRLIERQAVESLNKQVRAAERLDEITIPDLRNDSCAWLTLKLHSTNVNDQFIQDMTEYLSGASGIERALEIYNDLVEQFRSIGMVMGNLHENQLVDAMLNGTKQALTVEIGMPITEHETPDITHTLSVHLPTGTFVVSCNDAAASRDKIALAWEESCMLARLTGREDVLLAYAEEYVRTEHERSTKKIIDRRTALDT